MDEFRTMGVEQLSIFGSAARDDAGPTSDVDLLVELKSGVGLFKYASIKERLEEILGAPVDVATPNAPRPWMREQVLSEAIRAA